jgi:hypothetical protein
LSQANIIKKFFASYSPAQDSQIKGCIGGIHSNEYYFDSKNSGVVAPYTDIDSAASEVILANRGIKTDKLNIFAGHSGVGTNFYFSFFVTNESAISMSKKLGEVAYPNVQNLRGLANLNGRGKCYFDTLQNIGDCTNSDATLTQMNFYLAP